MIDLNDNDWTPMPQRPEPLPAQVPSRWKRRYSEEHDREYFENTESSNTAWELPEDAVLDPLPKGWHRRFSAENNKYYYANDDLGESVWNVSEIQDAQDFESSGEARHQNIVGD